MKKKQKQRKERTLWKKSSNQMRNENGTDTVLDSLSLVGLRYCNNSAYLKFVSGTINSRIGLYFKIPIIGYFRTARVISSVIDTMIAPPINGSTQGSSFALSSIEEPFSRQGTKPIRLSLPRPPPPKS